MKKICLVLAAAALALTSCVKDELFKGPSKIDSVVFTPEAPTSHDAVEVVATVSGLQAVRTATLYYGNAAVPMTPDNSGKKFKGTIPAMADGTEVAFTVKVVNEAEFETVSDKYTYKVGDPATDWSKLRFNEVSGSGADEEKFFELVNTGDFPIKLTGVTINKDLELSWTGIDGEVVPPHGFFAIIGAKGTTERGFSSGFSAKKNVIIELFNPAGQKLDTFQRGETPEDGVWGNQKLSENTGSWSRVPDGTGKWMQTETKTPGKANSATAVEDPDVKQ